MLLLSRRFYRAHGLGNDYLVCEVAGAPEASGSVPSGSAPSGSAPTGSAPAASTPSAADGWPLTREAVVALCRRGRGEGSDGLVVLLDRDPPEGEDFPLRMFNPDGSEFERSGNGLRILASWLYREGRVGSAPFAVRSGGIRIPMQVHGADEGGVYDVSVEMGRAHAGADAAHLVGWESGNPRIDHPELGPISFVPVWVGNPHAVVFVGGEPGVDPELRSGGADTRFEPDADLDGPLLEAIGSVLGTHPGFRLGTNVQLARVTPGGDVHIGIWERGVGRTPASGTSSCAAAVAAVATGRRPPGQVRVRMPGGELQVEVSAAFEVTLRGPVQEVAVGELAPGFVRQMTETRS